MCELSVSKSEAGVKMVRNMIGIIREHAIGIPPYYFLYTQTDKN